jgi:hypothetical protein
MNHVTTAKDQNSQTVAVKRLDDINDTGGAVLVKLDVEGFEDEVIKGSGDLLSSSNLLAIQCESHSPSMTNVLAAHGFKEYFYDPLSRALSPKSFGYKVSNALFIRSVAQIALRVTEAPRRKVYGSRI